MVTERCASEPTSLCCVTGTKDAAVVGSCWHAAHAAAVPSPAPDSETALRRQHHHICCLNRLNSHIQEAQGWF